MTADRWTITNELGILDLDTVTVEAARVFETLLRWFPNAHGDDIDALGDLEHALLHGEPTDVPAAFLGVRVDLATEDEDPCAEGCNPADSQAISATEDQCRRCGRTARSWTRTPPPDRPGPARFPGGRRGGQKATHDGPSEASEGDRHDHHHAQPGPDDGRQYRVRPVRRGA